MVLEDEWIAAHVEAGRWRHRLLWLGTTADKKQRRTHVRKEGSHDALTSASGTSVIRLGSGAQSGDVEMGKV
jgi:poly(3-hydroxyalkanoate) synthetase